MAEVAVAIAPYRNGMPRDVKTWSKKDNYPRFPVVAAHRLGVGRRDSNLCILESEFPKTLSPGPGLELAHLELKARPIDA